MKKGIIIGALTAVVLFIIIFFVMLSNLGTFITKVVNTYGPEITKTDVHLGDTSISIFSAKARLKDFTLGNPKGFSAKNAITVASILMDLDEKSLTKQTVIIDKIELVRPSITYEKRGGTDNFKTILQNIKQSQQATEKPAEKAPAAKDKGKKEEEKKFLIKDFIIKDGKVTVIIPQLRGKAISASLPDMHLKNIGSDTAGSSPEQVFSEVLGALYGKLSSQTITNTIDQGIKAVDPLLRGGGAEATKGVEQVKDKLKELFGK